MRPAKDPTPKPDLTPALRQALEAVLKRTAPAAATPGLAWPRLHSHAPRSGRFASLTCALRHRASRPGQQ